MLKFSQCASYEVTVDLVCRSINQRMKGVLPEELELSSGDIQSPRWCRYKKPPRKYDFGLLRLNFLLRLEAGKLSP